MRTFLRTVLLFGSSLMLAAQGYIYTFQGLPGYQQLDGSYIILSNAVAGPPTSADLLDIKILDSFGSSVFSMTVSPQNFNITAFDDQGFTGDMMGPCGSYTGNTIVRLVGLGTASQTGIYASDNGFFPGNPAGELVYGNWIATPLPEPSVGALLLASLAALAFRRADRSTGRPALR